MARYSKGPRLQLFGPNRKHGAKRKRGRTSYVWYIVWQENGRRRERSTGVELGQDPSAAFADFLNSYLRDSGPQVPSEFLLTDALAIYGEERAPSLADPLRYAASLKALAPFFTGKVVQNVTEAVCREYCSRRSDEGRKSGTIRRELDDLETAINWSVKQRYLSHGPKIWKPEKAPPRDRWLTRQEAARLLNSARTEPRVRDYLPLFILIGLYTGARRTAILQLQWEPSPLGGHVDLGQRLIDFNPLGRTQSNKRLPQIPIPRQLNMFLKLVRSRNQQWVIEANGKPIQKLRRSFSSAVKNAGLADVTAHTLRHTAITWALQNGMRPWDASAYFGVSLRVLTDIYGHHSPEFLDQALKIIERRN